MKTGDEKISKKDAYFFHTYSRAKDRYSLILNKRDQERICRAITEGDEYIPVQMIKDWGNRQMYVIEYMNIKARLVYDVESDAIVTFLPLIDDRIQYKCRLCKDKGWFTKRTPISGFFTCTCLRGKTLRGNLRKVKLEAFKAGLRRSQTLNGITLESLLEYASK